MEKMIAENHFCAVLDITTTELADEVAGGIYAVGPRRLRSAIERGIPCIVVPGALEMVNLSTEDTLLPEQRARTLYYHSPSSVKMRANKEEMKRLGEIFVQRMQDAQPGKALVMIPEGGFSAVNAPGKVFWDPEADRIFINELKYKMPGNVQVRIRREHINEEPFADEIVRQLLKMTGRISY